MTQEVLKTKHVQEVQKNTDLFFTPLECGFLLEEGSSNYLE